jgi:hypothetical protein
VPQEIAMSARGRTVVDDQSTLDDGGVAIDALTPEEAWDVFDRAARDDLSMSGEEFLRRWDAGAFRADPDQPGVMDVAMLIPLVR